MKRLKLKKSGFLKNFWMSRVKKPKLKTVILSLKSRFQAMAPFSHPLLLSLAGAPEDMALHHGGGQETSSMIFWIIGLKRKASQNRNFGKLAV